MLCERSASNVCRLYDSASMPLANVFRRCISYSNRRREVGEPGAGVTFGGFWWCKNGKQLITQLHLHELPIRIPDDDVHVVPTRVVHMADLDPNCHYWNSASSHNTDYQRSHYPTVVIPPCNPADPFDPIPSTIPVAAAVAGAFVADAPSTRFGQSHATTASSRSAMGLRAAGALLASGQRRLRPLNSDCSLDGPRASRAGECAASWSHCCSSCTASCPFPVT